MVERHITFGPNRQFHTLRVAMHELSHVLGMGTGVGWFSVRLNNATFASNWVGHWGGQEAIKELAMIRSVMGQDGELETMNYVSSYLNAYANKKLREP